MVKESSGKRPCPVTSGASSESAAAWADLLSTTAPYWGSDETSLGAYRAIVAALPERLAELLRAVDGMGFAKAVAARGVLRCWGKHAGDADQRAALAVARDTMLNPEPARYPWVQLSLASGVVDNGEELLDFVRISRQHPSCIARAGLVKLLIGKSELITNALIPALRQILEPFQKTRCWRLLSALVELSSAEPRLASLVPADTAISRYLQRQ